MSAANQAVFLSYASQDAEAAKRICEALRATGVEVWFDRSELRGGDAWDQKIREQIQTCALFVPVISTNTQSRPEGYFRFEWKLAVDRSHLMSDDHPFLVPVVIDETTDAVARVPARFRERQWTRLPAGETPPAFVDRVHRLLAGESVPALNVHETSAGLDSKSAFHSRGRPRLLAPAIAGGAVVVAAAIIFWHPWKGGEVAAPPAKVLSPTRELVVKARRLFEQEDDSNRENLELAADLLTQAEKLDPLDGEVWAAHAQLSGLLLLLGYDPSEARLAAVRRQAERAVQLAPGSVESQLANAWYLSSQRGTLSEAERVLTALIKRVPADGRPLRLMANDKAWQGDFEAANRWFDRAAAIPGGAAAALVDQATNLFLEGRIDEAEKAVDRSLAIRPLGRALLLKLRGQVLWDGDLDGAKQTLERMPPSLLLDDRGAFNAFRVRLWRREPDQALALLNGVSHDFLVDAQFTGPKAVLVAAAEQLAGRSELARPEWSLALSLIDDRLQTRPDQLRLLYLRTLCLVELGRSAEADTALQALQQTGRDDSFQMWPGGGVPGLLLKLGRPAAALEALEAGVDRGIPLFHSRAVLSLNPAFDPLRGDPRFKAILARSPGPVHPVWTPGTRP